MNTNKNSTDDEKADLLCFRKKQINQRCGNGKVHQIPNKPKRAVKWKPLDANGKPAVHTPEDSDSACLPELFREGDGFALDKVIAPINKEIHDNPKDVWDE